MPLVPGRHLGPYEILAPLGAGGMGEVYRAKDTRLGREVALKVLPELFANDAQRMLRFEREAQVLASLNHPNISHIHGLEEAAGIRALVMELVEGQTLGGRITRGPIGLEEAVPLAKQIAEGLEYAHERGFIHRDLKPANIKVTPEGQARILDFGLAKALERDASEAEMGTSPTISRAATNVGMLLGTAGYMSPEQAKGKPVDRRADIWAFGCVLFEMLTGKRAFEGETITDTLAAVVRAEPELEQLPEKTPVGIRELLRRCLTKDPKQRLQSIGEARIALENYAKAPDPETSGVAPALKSRGGWWFAAVGVALLGIASAFFLRPRTLDTASQLNAAILPPPGDGFWANITQPAAISPDGKFLALIAMRNGHAQLWLRRLDITDAQPITGSEDASNPFWSPDSRQIAFFVPGHCCPN
jgi:serine/threonine protein kinase